MTFINIIYLFKDSTAIKTAEKVEFDEHDDEFDWNPIQCEPEMTVLYVKEQIHKNMCDFPPNKQIIKYKGFNLSDDIKIGQDPDKVNRF